MSGYKSPLLRLGGLIAQDKTLAALLPEAERLTRLNQRLGRAAPALVARQCRIAALEGASVLIYCGTGAAAARVRSLASTLARALSGGDVPIQDVRVKVRADWARANPPAKPGMSGAGLAAWRDLDASLPDGELKTAVERLLRHQRR